MKPHLTRETFITAIAPYSNYVSEETPPESTVIELFEVSSNGVNVQWDERFVTLDMLKALARWAGVPMDYVRLYTRSTTAHASIDLAGWSKKPRVRRKTGKPMDDVALMSALYPELKELRRRLRELHARMDGWTDADGVDVWWNVEEAANHLDFVLGAEENDEKPEEKE